MLGGRGDQSKLDPNRQPICLLLGGGMAAGKSTVRKIIGQAEFWTRVSFSCDQHSVKLCGQLLRMVCANIVQTLGTSRCNASVMLAEQLRAIAKSRTTICSASFWNACLPVHFVAGHDQTLQKSVGEQPPLHLMAEDGQDKSWVAWYDTWLHVKLSPKGIVFSFFSLQDKSSALCSSRWARTLWWWKLTP